MPVSLLSQLSFARTKMQRKGTHHARDHLAR